MKPTGSLAQLELHAMVRDCIRDPLDDLACEILNADIALAATARAYRLRSRQFPKDAIRAFTYQRSGPIIAPGKNGAIRPGDGRLPFFCAWQTFAGPFGIRGGILAADTRYRVIAILNRKCAAPSSPPRCPLVAQL